MKKSTRVTKAKETLEIMEHGYFHANDKKIVIKDALTASLAGSRLYSPADLDMLMEQISARIATENQETKIVVQNSTVLKAASSMVLQGEKVGCLNFASAKNPGGGFLGGAVAQEESLALSSSLYGTLMANFEMYEYNRNRSTMLYSDYMIWSPDVVFFRNDDGDLLEQPYQLSVVTSPAVNVGAILNVRREELPYVEAVMLQRMDKVLALMYYAGMQHLLLGAWGCGVFRNDPRKVAQYFATYLAPGGKYSRCFKSVVFAVLDRNHDGVNINAFKSAFGQE
ncbi:MAG: TIGR02452 family protein [Chitinophaga sp.]|uniref:TIGR02452 family protein n=1 Tax=Chitinophaga sp. TaxID=1869181 RepID=UPI0025BFFCE2|nr:TIGR02452 family protein [Chitinophaga sp.]MBV8251351.1 TIGR02452 family protein [Chitinophaga sp.]